ncbi:ferric reductase-like transmembrane domain-containing protein [Raoultibacter phocaeensis]|uniref:ferric reductase-like transmembrane domain-containing protein n=1 Tax=Raoultibacter phocaeensis TaxID=2479841 RepID=UPI001118F42A|nr:ferric reductase-like transmembrane domain-containing protein [Raoultibacter phocaeensis]
MDIILALVISVVFACALRNAIRAHPAVFYLIATAIVAAFAALSFGGDIPALARIAYPYVQRCLLAFGLIAVVMFIGVLPEASKARTYLAPIRGELSIIAAILAIGHVVNYLASYAGQFASRLGNMPTTMIASFAVSFLLVALLAALTATSIQAVRKRMSGEAWKRIQRLAYPFFLLVFVHVLLILGPSASGFGQKASTSIIVYTVLFGSYCVLRIGKAIRERSTQTSKASSIPARE